MFDSRPKISYKKKSTDKNFFLKAIEKELIMAQRQQQQKTAEQLHIQIEPITKVITNFENY